MTSERTGEVPGGTLEVMAIVLTIKVECDVTDEATLRAAAASVGFGIRESRYDSGDVATRLLLLSVQERLALPGTRVVGATMNREHHLEG